MSKSFFTGKDSELYTGSANFSTKISSTPTAYNLTAAEATAYAALNATYATAYLASIDPMTRNKGSTLAKNAARANLKKAASDLAKRINSDSAVTDQQLADLGLNVRAQPSPKPVPATAPDIDIVSVDGWTVKVRIHDSVVGKRGKPPAVVAATVFTFTGPVAPTDVTQWTWQGTTGRNLFDVALPGTLAAGTRIWITAVWQNAKGQSGPAAAPVATYVQFGGMSMAA